MLLSFKCDNFKSFQDGFTFSMVPEKRMHELEYSILKKKAGREVESALSTSIVYGANAAGKTSVINAMSCMRQIVLRGNVNDMEDDRSGDHVSHNMLMAPFAFGTELKPVSFEVTFVFHDVKYCYGVSVFLGEFLQKEDERFINQEWLYVNDKLIFDRVKDSVIKLSLNSIEEFLNVGYTSNDARKTKITMSNNIVMDTLLLTSDFSSFCSKKMVAEIKYWFKNQFLVINSAARARFVPNFDDGIAIENQAFIEKNINRIAKEAGIIGTDLAYVKDSETHMTKVVSVLRKDDRTMYGLEADRIESAGTLRLVSIMPVIIAAMGRGAVLVMDEIDASLHPELFMNLISIFHNDEVNIYGAQLIFNTHNVIYLNHNLFRRDEIKFVERDRETKASCLYALSDFKANGKESVRKTSDYMKNYLMNRYGAIPELDFTDIIADMVKRVPVNENK